MARVSRKNRAEEILNHEIPSTAVSSEMTVYKTAIYARLSREDNLSDSDSIDNQIALIQNYIESRPYLQYEKTYTDNGFTGTDFDRPGWKSLLEDAKSGKINCIVVKDLSRLGRNYIETGEFLEKICPFFGIRFIAVVDNFDTETAESTAQLSVSLSNIVNDYYAKDISRKVSTALRNKMEHGEYIGSWEKYGYMKSAENKNQLIVNPETAPVVRMIYEWRRDGMSYMGINKKLNDLQIPSPGQYKADRGIVTNNNQKARRILWNKHIVTDILKDITYLGHLAQRKTAQCLYAGLPVHRAEEKDWIVVENTHEPIIEQALFDAVQKINEEAAQKSKATYGKYDHLPKAVNIYGKKFTCADCGAVIKLFRSFSTKKDKVYFTFKCPTFQEHGDRACKRKRIRKADLDAVVLESIKTQLALFVDMDATLKQLLKAKKAMLSDNSHAKEIRTVKAELAKKKTLFSGLYQDFQEGILTQDDYASTREILVRDIEKLEKQLSELTAAKKENTKQTKAEKELASLVKKYSKATEMTQELADAMIESMQLHDDNSVSITFRYMDEFKAVMESIEALRKEVA